MCVSPNKLDDGSLIACRNCWQCRERRVLDWQGRCIAEGKTSVGAHVVTLTYGPVDGKESHERAAVLTFSDVQKFLKRIRKAGFPCSYFVAGEYGSSKGRAHWHIVLYWHEVVPTVALRKNIQFAHWPHGYTYWDEVSASSVRYVCKYLLKDLDDAERQGHLSMSKKPPLGARYFARRAQDYVDAGLAPQDLFYSFPEAKAGNGSALQFLLAGRSAEMFLTAFMRKWRGYPEPGFHGPPCPVRGWNYPESEVVQEFEDKLTRETPSRYDAQAFEQELKERVRPVEIWQNEIPEEKREQIDPTRLWRATKYAARMAGQEY